MKTFPIHSWGRSNQLPDTIPWDQIAPHEAQALQNHDGQTLDHLAGRGGLSACEMIAVLEDRKWRRMQDGESTIRLLELLNMYKQINP